MTAALIVIALMAAGMVLLIAEVAIIPGFGVAGVAAALLIVGGGIFAWVRFGPTWGMGSLLLAGLATYAVLKIIPKTRMGKDLVLSDALKSPLAESNTKLVGAEGLTITALRPAGVADLEGKRVDVVTDGVFLEAGRRVRVVAVDGTRVVVAPVDQA